MEKILFVLLITTSLTSCAVTKAYKQDYPNHEVSPIRYLIYGVPPVTKTTTTTKAPATTAPATTETPTPPSPTPANNEPPAIESAHKL